jgi:hypothetical protein
MQLSRAKILGSRQDAVSTFSSAPIETDRCAIILERQTYANDRMDIVPVRTVNTKAAIAD